MENIITSREQRQIEKDLFEMVYKWGNAGIVTNELCNAFQDKLEEYRKLLEDSYATKHLERRN